MWYDMMVMARVMSQFTKDGRPLEKTKRPRRYRRQPWYALSTQERYGTDGGGDHAIDVHVINNG